MVDPSEAFIHYPTLLDWIEHIMVMGFCAVIGWRARGAWEDHLWETDDEPPRS